MDKRSSKSEQAPTTGIMHHDDINLTLNPDAFGLSEQQALFTEYVARGKSRVDAYRLAGIRGQGMQSMLQQVSC